MTTHSKAAATFIKNLPKTKWHDEILWKARSKRDVAAGSIPEWEQLRELASQIKDNVLSHLDEYLLEFEENAIANGAEVFWAKDGDEHNKIVGEILKKHNINNLVKSKSILTEECHLNQYLENIGYDVVDTDLGERIIQFARQPPSHIVTPAIHLNKSEIGKLFHEHLGTEEGAEDPQYLTEVARQHLREKFLNAEAAITGVNFAIAETGGFVVCTNEGNADMGVNLAPIQIACMGIEKLIPKANHLGVFLRLLARSATGQSITNYTSHFHKPKQGGKLYIVMVDNGRAEQLGRKDFKNSLKCIRCGACMNTCPVYRRSGGYSYGYTIPGPIGSVLSPGRDANKYSSLPFASTLCGSCTDVCPVKIDLHDQLYKWRQEIARKGHLPWSKKISLKLAGAIFERPTLYRFLGKSARVFLKLSPRFMVYHSLNPWGKARELPSPPRESFRDWYVKRKKI